MLWRANFSACKPVSGRGVADEETFLSCPRKPEECDAFQADAVNKAPWKRCWLANLDGAPSFLRAIARARIVARASIDRERAHSADVCAARLRPMPGASKWRRTRPCALRSLGPNYDLETLNKSLRWCSGTT